MIVSLITDKQTLHLATTFFIYGVVMLITFTTDLFVTSWVNSQPSNAKAWGRIKKFRADTKENATEEMCEWLTELGNNEPLCLSGFGTNGSFGFENWFKWHSHELAQVFRSLPLYYSGDIYFDDSQGASGQYLYALANYVNEYCSTEKIKFYTNRTPINPVHAFFSPTFLKNNSEQFHQYTLDNQTKDDELNIKNLLIDLQRQRFEEDKFALLQQAGLDEKEQ